MWSNWRTYKPYYRDSLTLALPVVVSQLGHTLVQVADGVIVGHFAGTIPLAAVSLVNGVFMLILVVGIGLSYAITPLIAQENGRNNTDECGRLLINALLINLITGLVLFAGVYLGSRYGLDYLGQSPQVVAQAKPYLNLLGLSVIPLLVFNTFKQFAEGLGFTAQAMSISIWGNIINVILGITFVKGLLGFSPMGVRGVGYSTLIDRCLMALVMMLYVLRAPRFKPYLAYFKLAYLDAKRMLKLLGIGAPVAMQYAFEISAFTGANLLIGTVSAVAQAAHQVAISLAAMTYMMSSGISAAAAIKAGNYHGAKNYQGLRLSAQSSYHLVLVFMSFTAILFAALRFVLPWLYTNDAGVIAVSASLLLVAAFFQLFDGAQVVGLGILRGMGDVKIPTLITFLAYWVLGLPVGYYLGIVLHWGAVGIWYGLVLGLFAAALLLYLRFNYLSKVWAKA